MMEWYAQVKDKSLQQGDILTKVKVYNTINIEDPVDGTNKMVTEDDFHDVIILTQTCDIENKKVSRLLLAELTSLEKAKEERPSIFSTTLVKQQLRQNSHPAFALIPPNRMLYDTSLDLEPSIIGFQDLYTVERAIFESQLEGNHLRLNSPYKEHIAQMFARNLMRVALEIDLKEFKL